MVSQRDDAVPGVPTKACWLWLTSSFKVTARTSVASAGRRRANASALRPPATRDLLESMQRMLASSFTLRSQDTGSFRAKAPLTAAPAAPSPVAYVHTPAKIIASVPEVGNQLGS